MIRPWILTLSTRTVPNGYSCPSTYSCCDGGDHVLFRRYKESRTICDRCRGHCLVFDGMQHFAKSNSFSLGVYYVFCEYGTSISSASEFAA